MMTVSFFDTALPKVNTNSMNDQPGPQGKGYGKRPLWQWIVIYVVIGGIVYGAVYYFAIAKKGGYGTTNSGNQNTSRGIY